MDAGEHAYDTPATAPAATTITAARNLDKNTSLNAKTQTQTQMKSKAATPIISKGKNVAWDKDVAGGQCDSEDSDESYDYYYYDERKPLERVDEEVDEEVDADTDAITIANAVSDARADALIRREEASAPKRRNLPPPDEHAADVWRRVMGKSAAQTPAKQSKEFLELYTKAEKRGLGDVKLPSSSSLAVSGRRWDPLKGGGGKDVCRKCEERQDCC